VRLCTTAVHGTAQNSETVTTAVHGTAQNSEIVHHCSTQYSTEQFCYVVYMVIGVIESVLISTSIVKLSSEICC